MSTVRIVRGLLEARVFSPFEAKDVIKRLPTRRWDKGEKCWVIPNTDIPLLQITLQGSGFTTWVVDDPRSQPADQGKSHGTWADRMFAELEPPLADKAFKALIRVLHPDTGGSTTAMQALNSARDKARIGR